MIELVKSRVIFNEDAHTYELDGKEIHEFPVTKDLERCKPVFRSIIRCDMWISLRRTRERSLLPSAL